MMDAEHIKLEMTYTSWDWSCKEPHLTPAGELIECRREDKHQGRHAVLGGGTHGLITWT